MILQIVRYIIVGMIPSIINRTFHCDDHTVVFRSLADFDNGVRQYDIPFWYS